MQRAQQALRVAHIPIQRLQPITQPHQRLCLLHILRLHLHSVVLALLLHAMPMQVSTTSDRMPQAHHWKLMRPARAAC